MTISRRNFYLIIAALVALIAYWLWPESRWSHKNFPPSAQGPWVAFGDSLTEGYGASAGADYPSQLGKLLGVTIQNLGVSGDTTADGLNRIASVEALEPRVVLLCFGGNDVLRNSSREKMFANLAVMIDRLQARGSFVVLIGIRDSSLLGDDNAENFRKLARSKQVMHVPNMLDGILTSSALMADYIHPNDAGYARIAERLAGELRPLLPDLAAAR